MRIHVLLPLLLACVGAEPVAPTEPPPASSSGASEVGAETTSPTPSPAEHPALAVDGWQVVPLPLALGDEPLASPLVFAHASDRRLVVTGRHRLALGPGDAAPRIASDVFASPVLGAVPMADAEWLFLTRDGALWHAERFMARPTLVHHFPGAIAFAGVGRGAVVTATGRLIATDGATHVPVEEPPATLFSAAFLNARTLVAGGFGAAFESSDGGLRWRELEASEDTRGHGYRIALGEAGAEIGLGGLEWAQVSWPDSPPPAFRVTDSLEVLSRVGEALRPPWQTMVPALPHGTVVGPDGRLQPIEGLPDDCEPIDDERRLELCEDGTYVIGGGQAQRLGRSAAVRVGESLLVANDGASVFRLEGGCAGGPSPDAICWVDVASGRSRTVRVRDALLDAPVGAHGSVAVFESTGDALFVVTDGARTRAIPRPADLARAVLRDRAVTSDGWISATVLRSGYGGPPDVVGLLVDPRDGQLHEVALPEGAMGVAFRDRARGVAAGRDLSRLWVTDDGGERWRPIRPRLVGDASAVPLVGLDAHVCLAGLDSEHPDLRRHAERVADPEECGWQYTDDWILCDRDGCAVHERFWVGSDHVQVPRELLHAAPVGPFEGRSDE